MQSKRVKNGRFVRMFHESIMEDLLEDVESTVKTFISRRIESC